MLPTSLQGVNKNICASYYLFKVPKTLNSETSSPRNEGREDSGPGSLQIRKLRYRRLLSSPKDKLVEVELGYNAGSMVPEPV